VFLCGSGQNPSFREKFHQSVARDPDHDAVVQQRGNTPERIAINMVAWFSQRITVGNSPWAARFERTKIDYRCAYKPISNMP
jgi:hypothetical protein